MRNERKKKTRKKMKRNESENMFLSFFLDGWSVPRRALGNARFLTLLTASGRSDQSHRLAPVSNTPFSCPPKTTGRVGRALKIPHTPERGALTTARPLLVNARPTGETCAKNLADTCYTASGPRAGISTLTDKAHHNRKVNEWATECATHIFPSKN